MKHILHKLHKDLTGMAMIIVLTVVFVVLITVGIGATIIANNLSKSGHQSANSKADMSIVIALERLRGMYKVNAALLSGCAANDCIKHSDGTCVSCSDEAAIYKDGDVKYKMKISSLNPPDYGNLVVGNASLLVTGYYKDTSKDKTVDICLNYCAGSNGYDCGDNGCGGTCGTCVEPATCGGGGEAYKCGTPIVTSCSDISLECGDECSVGAECGGGIIIDATNNIVATPASCDGSSCSGETDIITYKWDENSLLVGTGANYYDNGEDNMPFLTDESNNGNYTAALFCDNSSYYGFEDWYLPAKNELLTMYNSGYITGYANDYYWSSTQDSKNPNGKTATMLFSDGSFSPQVKDLPFYIRCLRRF